MAEIRLYIYIYGHLIQNTVEEKKINQSIASYSTGSMIQYHIYVPDREKNPLWNIN